MNKLVSTQTGRPIDPHIKSKARTATFRVMVWRFEDAPRALRLLNRDLPSPEWLVLVPYALVGSDIEESIVNSAESSGVFRHKTSTGDVVYIGKSAVNQAEKHLRTSKAESTVFIRSGA